MKPSFLSIILLILLAGTAAAEPDEGVEFFEAKIRPVLANSCFACHGPKMQMAGLNLSTADSFFKGGQRGPVVIKGDPENSRLIQAVSYGGELKMPPDGKLQDQQIADLKKWVAMGAPWPRSVASAIVSGSQTTQYGAAQRDFWSFCPVKKVDLPAVRDVSWIRTPVDRFILAKLESRGLRPAPPG